MRTPRPPSPPLIDPRAPVPLLKVFLEENSGFNTTATDQLTYNTWLAGQVCTCMPHEGNIDYVLVRAVSMHPPRDTCHTSKHETGMFRKAGCGRTNPASPPPATYVPTNGCFYVVVSLGAAK